MAIQYSEFITRFPEFSDKSLFPEPRVQLFIDDAVILHLGTDEARWGGKYDIAHSYLSAHLLSVATDSEMGDKTAKMGPISSKSAGGVSVTRSVVSKDLSTSDDFLNGTVYGVQFKQIRNMCFVGVMAANQ